MSRAQRASRPAAIRPRVICPACKRSIAVTFNGTSTPYLRPHNAGIGPRWVGQVCQKSGRPVGRHLLNP